MKNILLCCSAGMSTSLLVTKMQKYCKEKEIDYNIWAIPSDKISEEISKADIVLLGPQIKYLKSEIEGLAAEYKIPVEIINLMDYGMMNGGNVIKFTQEILKKREEMTHE